LKKLLLLFFVSFMLSGCSKKEGLLFCEGVTPEGEGVNCGKVFTTGDLTAVIKTKEPFGNDSLTVIVKQSDSEKNKHEKKITIPVDREKTTATTTLQFYNEGKYSVEILNNDSVVAGGNIEIKDIY